jgi:hypothetical protein
MARREQTLGDSIEQYSYGRAGISTGSGMGNSARLEEWQRTIRPGGASRTTTNDTPQGLIGTFALFGTWFYLLSQGMNLLEGFLYTFGAAIAASAVISVIRKTRIGRFFNQRVPDPVCNGATRICGGAGQGISLELMLSIVLTETAHPNETFRKRM